MTVLYLIALIFTLTSAGVPNPPNYGQSMGHEHDHNFSLKELAEKVFDPSNDLGTIYQDIATARTLNDVGHENLVLFGVRYVAATKLQDSQKDALIKILDDEVFDLRHREDVLQTSVDKIAELANGTASEIAMQFNDVRDIQTTDNKQNATIFCLEKELAQAMSNFNRNLSNSFAFLNDQLDITRVNESKRNCEYGTITLFNETAVKLKFNVQFEVTPSVSAAIIGFLFDLSHHGNSEHDDKNGHDKKDHEKYGEQGHEYYGEQGHEYYGEQGHEYYGEQGHEEQEHPKHANLGSKITVSDVTQTGFTLSVKNMSHEPVYFRKVSVNWVACAKLDIVIPGINMTSTG